jgi:hypothetical protein
MSRAIAFRLIQSFGMIVHFTSNGEYILNYPIWDERRQRDSSYATTDVDDAIITARLMSGRI